MIHKDALLPLNGWLNRNMSGKKSFTLPIAFLFRELLTVLSCFLIGRAVLFDQIAPFGIALFAVLLTKRKGGLSAFLAVSAGFISIRFGPGAGGAVLAMFLFSVVWSFFGRKSVGWSVFQTAVTTMVCIFTTKIMFSIWNGFLMYEILMGLFESIVGFVMVIVFSRSVHVVWDSKRRHILSGEEMICLSIFLSLIIIGVWDITILNLSIRNIFTIFLILLFAYAGGAGAGAAVGITAGFMLSLASTPDPTLIGNLAICGLLAGTFKELGRSGTSIAFFLANILMTFYINRSTYIILPFGEIAGAVVFLFVLPQRTIDYFKQFLNSGLLRADEQQHYGKRVQELTVGRLNEFAQVFRHLSKVFGRISDRSSSVGQEELSRLFDMVAEQVCKGCPLYRSCWERDFYHTYTAVFELLSACEEKGTIEHKDIPASMARRCLNVQTLVENLNMIYQSYQTNLKWQQKMNDCRQLVAEQLEGVGHVVTELAAELDMDIRFRTGLEDAIRLELDKNGIHAKEILVLEKHGGKTEVMIRKPACDGCRECMKKVEPIVSKVMNKPMSRQSKECIQGGKSDCILHLAEARQYEIITGVARQPKKDSTICGDSYSFTSVKDGRYMMALSDGMGFGARAAEESSAVISLLENFLEAGFDQGITIKTINSILMLRSREEMFATADLCILDLVGGEADFIKIGGVSSFIRRSDEVEVFRQSALPMGILEDVQMQNISVPIFDEDMVIMVTDGIIDAFSSMGDGEQALKNFIATMHTTNPQELADLVMEEGMYHSEGEANDDMTVMAGRIWKPF